MTTRQILERLFATLGLAAISPLLALIALLIKIDSPGPVFFLQERVGRDGGRFRIFKFRSMRVGADNEHAKLMEEKIKKSGSFLVHNSEDERATRIGHLLRRTSLDELPQLLNVIRGEMSLVGPRPMLPEEVAHLPEHFKRRFDVLPGVTGLAQINGRGALPVEEYLGFDLQLVDEMSWRLYLKILLATPSAALGFKKNL